MTLAKWTNDLGDFGDYWSIVPGDSHGGDLPNIYAAADGSARADFFSQGITLDTNLLHTILDADGSAIIVHEFPDSYGDEESNTGRRLACGVIRGT